MNNCGNTPVVSIIVITYNQEKYIEQCINSILNQKTSYPYEIVVSDDNSSDRTLEVVKRLALNYTQIRFYKNLINLGIVKNYISALRMCKGNYICLIGGDDYWIDEYKIQDQVEFLEFNKGYGLVYSDYDVLNQDTGGISKNYVISNFKETIHGDALLRLCLGDSQIMSLTTCIRASLLGENYKRILDDKGFIAEDYPTCFWVSYYSQIYFLNRSTAVYRVHNKSFTNSQSNLQKWKFSRSTIYMRHKIMTFLDYSPKNWENLNEANYRYMMTLALKNGIRENYGLYYFKRIKRRYLEDYLISLGLRCRSLSMVVRIVISLMKRLKIIPVINYEYLAKKYNLT